jgi:hypothetical protein
MTIIPAPIFESIIFPVLCIPGMWGEGIIENGGGEFNCDIL